MFSSLEEILQSRSIHELRDLVVQLDREGQSKQTELQQMVRDCLSLNNIDIIVAMSLIIILYSILNCVYILQVGSTYHDFIQSADTISIMKVPKSIYITII